MRIVSLIASATEIIHALGLDRFQVGRSHECDYPEAILTLPVCTAPAFPINGSSAEIDRHVKARLAGALSIYEVFPDVLDQLQPTHVVTQTQCKVCAVSPADVERALAVSVCSHPKLIALEPNALQDIWEDIRRVAEACAIAPTGESVIQKLQDRVNELTQRAANSTHRPRVACIEWLEPLMAAGNWIPELVELANAEDLFGTAGCHSPWMTWEDLAGRDPDTIVVMPCGFPLDRTRQEMYWISEKPGWANLRAVREHRVFLADANQYLTRPGPRTVESLQILAEVLHPDAFEPALEGVAWERWPT